MGGGSRGLGGKQVRRTKYLILGLLAFFEGFYICGYEGLR